MDAARKITVEVPADLLERAQRSSGLGVTQTVPDWQVAISLLLVLLTTLLTVWAASRVFRVGILSQGRLPKLRELARWVFSS